MTRSKMGQDSRRRNDSSSSSSSSKRRKLSHAEKELIRERRRGIPPRLKCNPTKDQHWMSLHGGSFPGRRKALAIAECLRIQKLVDEALAESEQFSSDEEPPEPETKSSKLEARIVQLEKLVRESEKRDARRKAKRDAKRKARRVVVKKNESKSPSSSSKSSIKKEPVDSPTLSEYNVIRCLSDLDEVPSPALSPKPE